MKVAKLTTTQKNKLVGKNYAPDSIFNPIQDINGYWVISLEEVEQCNVETFLWVKNLVTIDYEPIPSTTI